MKLVGALVLLSTIGALSQLTDNQIHKGQHIKLSQPRGITDRHKPPDPIVTTNIQNKLDDDKIPLPPDIPSDWSPEDDELIKENIKTIRRYHLEKTSNITTKKTLKPFHQKYGTVSPRINTKHTFKDFIKKYEPITVWEDLDKERILTGKNMSMQKAMTSILKGIDNTDELLSLPVENGNAKLPVQISGRRYRVGYHLKGQPLHMHIHNFIIELMKQAIYQARNRMIFMQDLRSRHRKSGLYKMGFLFAKTDNAGKVFSSVCQKAYRMCSMLRQGISGAYRPFQHYLDVVYALERMETKWFDVDLLADMINKNDQMVKEQILKDKKLKTPRDLNIAFNKMFIE